MQPTTVRLRLTTMIILVLCAFKLHAGEFKIVAGGGYKKPVQAVIHAYHSRSGRKIDAGYGNMRQILSQAKASSRIALVIGDRKFLEQESIFSDDTLLGKGKLVLAWASSTQKLTSADELADSRITRIAHPNAKKAIYGRAALEWLHSHQLENTLKDKLIQTATVPQVSSYLVAREIDAGFINLTDAIGLGDRIGGYLPLETGYTPIQIVAARVNTYRQDKDVQAFIDFLRSPEARTIFKQYGM
ncbi:molybdate ABC transporter substrate-binding protein [Thiomicrorhabdus sp.]|uniref:molybdate ABC transporter substrate-binding protein n=1 Tax=Thiomicrorhabdus sp. TaxID=2039724 RepID=UPI0029C83717|nr:molybdate ABC transporter substrate-binding protein [Thiomicrorhabdus sp.]